MSKSNPVEPRQIRARLGIRDDVVDGNRVADRRDADVFDHRAAITKDFQRVVEIRADFSFQFVHRFANDPEAEAANAGVEIGGVVVNLIRRRR